jgi:hypothetical protein
LAIGFASGPKAEVEEPELHRLSQLVNPIAEKEQRRNMCLHNTGRRIAV